MEDEQLDTLSITSSLRDAIAGNLASHLASLPETEREQTAGHYRRQCEDYRTLARMHYFHEYAAAALSAAQNLPGIAELKPRQLLLVLCDAYDIAAALRKH